MPISFPHRLEAILICRLVLNLRRVPREQYLASVDLRLSRDQSTIPQMRFVTSQFLGNIGAPLRDNVNDCEGEGAEACY